MTASQMLAWINVAQVLIAAGIATEQQIAAFIRSVHGQQMTEPELNAVCEWVVSDAARRKALADADAATA